MTKTLEFRKKHERAMYFNIERMEAFEKLAGKTILVQRKDVQGNPYAETYTVPNEIGDFTYDAFDEYVKFIESHLPEEE